MPFLAALSPETASKLVVAVALGALTTAGAGAGTATLLTASPNPSIWMRAYQHATECHQAGADRDPNCSSAAAQALTEQRIAATIESKAKSVAAQRDQSPAPVPSQPIGNPKPGIVGPPAATAVPDPHRNSGESDSPDD